MSRGMAEINADVVLNILGSILLNNYFYICLLLFIL